MIVFITGVPGAGKSYYSVDKIFEFVKSNKYKSIYTNIDQFNFDFSPIVKKFVYEDFYTNINDLFMLYKQKDSTDDDLISLIKEFGYYKSLFVIDESHNFFDSLNPAITWLFSYHRHLFLDFYLITQNLALIETKYKKFAEYFVRAVPTSLQLFNHTFKYKKFIDSRMSAKSLAGVEKIKKNKEIFDLYHSGDSVKTENIIKKYLIWFAVGCLLVFFMFKVVLSFFKGGQDVKNQNVSKRDKVSLSGNINRSIQQKDRRFFTGQKEEINQKTIYTFVCLKNDCFYKDNYFSISLPSLRSLIKTFNCSLILKDSQKNSVSYVLKCSDLSNVLNIQNNSIQRNQKNEVITKHITSSFSNPSD